MIIHLYFHSNSLSEPSQNVKITLWWPRWRIAKITLSSNAKSKGKDKIKNKRATQRR